MNPEEREGILQLLAPAYRGEEVVLPKDTPVDPTLFRECVFGSAAGSGNQPLRWILHNAIFSGKLDLNDARGNGGPLPAMEFRNCRFENGFCAIGAHFERLRFEACTFTANDQEANLIELRNIRIATELSLLDLRPEASAQDPEAEHGLLRVDAFAAQIGTNVVVKRSLFRAPQNDATSLKHDARYALDLATARIGSDVQMQPAVVLEGGLKIRDARIGGSLWGQGLHVTDGETESTRKSISERGDTPRYGIFGQSLMVEGVVALSVDYQRRSEGAIPATLENLEPTSSPDPTRFWCLGHVNLLSSRINGQVDLRGGYMGGVESATMWLDGAEIRGSLMAPQTTIPLVLERTQRVPFRVLEVPRFSARGCHVFGDCDLHVRSDDIRLEGSTIDGKLTVSGTVVQLSTAGAAIAGDTELSITSNKICNLGGSKLSGQLDLGSSNFAQGLLSVRDAHIGHSFILASLYEDIGELRRRRLSCYPNYMLSEVTLPPDHDENALLAQMQERGIRIASFLTRSTRRRWLRKAQTDPTRVILLDGHSSSFHLLNARGYLKLNTHEQAEEYLRLFCAFTWAEEGSFALVERDLQLPTRFRGKVPVHNLHAVKEQGIAQYSFEVYCRYGLSLRKVKFTLALNGIPSMADEAYVMAANELVAYHPDEIPTYQYPFRIASQGVRSEFLSDARVSAGTDAERAFLSEVPDWSERIVRDRLHKSDVDLRDATCGVLQDNAGRIWERAQRIRLEGFCYAGTFMPTKSSVEGEVQVRRFWLRGKPYQSRSQRAVSAFARFLYLIGVVKIFRLIVWHSIRRLSPRTMQLSGYSSRLNRAQKAGHGWRFFKAYVLRAVRVTLSTRYKFASMPERPFRAQPYAQLAKVLRERGDDEAARDIEADKIYWGAYDRALGSFRGWLAFLFWWTPYGFFFRFGLAPIRAFLTLLVVWFAGFCAISMLSESNMLVANVTTVAAAAQGTIAVVPTVPSGQYVETLPCGESIAPALYAAELLTPVLNLHQENRCDITSSPPSASRPPKLQLWGHVFRHPVWMEEPRKWEYLKAIYIVLGTVVSSLSLLTFSGIARRWES